MPEVVWRNWWGSPEAFATVIEEAATALGAPTASPTVSITASSDSYHRELNSVDAFRGLAPELIPELLHVTGSCSLDDSEVTFELQRFPRLSRKRETARLDVVAPDPAWADVLMGMVIPHAAKGYRAYWGICEAPAEFKQAAHDRGLAPSLLTKATLSGLIGLIVGIGLGFATVRFHLPAITAGFVVIGLLVPTAIDFVIPDVQIAAGGKTRVVVFRTYLAGALAAAAIGWVKGLYGL